MHAEISYTDRNVCATDETLISFPQSLPLFETLR